MQSLSPNKGSTSGADFILSGWGIPMNATVSYGSTFYPILEITNAYIKFRAVGVTNNQVFTVSDSLGNPIPCSTAC
jgi:hypothetical protein